MAVSVVLGVDVYLVNAVCLEEVVKVLGPLAAPHDHPEVNWPVPTPNAMGCCDQPSLANQTGSTVSGSPQ